MLVLERKLSERIFIGDDIIITVVRIDGYKIRLGIEAPKDMRIDREELRQRIEDEGANGGEK
jgi:carbon storage regulator